MQSLFEKIETVQVDNSNLIDEADKNYCETLFAKYTVHSTFWTIKLQEMEQARLIYQDQERATEKDFYYALYPADKIFDNWRELINKLNRTVIEKLESYFKEKYHVEFASISLQVKDGDLPPFLSYQPIIENMIHQVGTDLQQSGKDLIKQEFMDLFKYERSQPELIGKKIAFPCFSYLERSYSNGSQYLSYDDKRLKKLILAANLLFSQTTELSILQQQRYSDWRNNIELSTDYNIGSFSVKFYKNARVDLSFENAVKASQFMNAYQLAGITGNR